ncbi:sulfur carrier protein ThiS [Evansella tamaricis]|uniref:Sulfur carrier protein ThiS n=1 Tax=Evansella tamaricis TaxID=2069301 RepID=A0ABS6JDZ3_9BACI|nr:sulfur carrier protein ThiS [Evansella tamaricis]MBU9710558.1 sulfur carrier protein ThiS [Evansella tamaricis]
MELILNGKKTELPDSVNTITLLINYCKLKKKVVIVELNGSIIEKNDHEGTSIEDGDQIELVHFVGGG